MSKSELRRLEIVAPEAIKQLREQIAQEISTEEESFECPNFHPVGMSGCDYCIPFRYGLETAAAIARGEHDPR